MLITISAVMAILGWFVLGMYIIEKNSSLITRLLLALSFVAIVITFIK